MRGLGYEVVKNCRLKREYSSYYTRSAHIGHDMPLHMHERRRVASGGVVFL